MAKNENREARKLWERIQRHQRDVDKLKTASVPRGLGAPLVKAFTSLRKEQVERSEQLIQAYVVRLKELMEDGANPFK